MESGNNEALHHVYLAQSSPRSLNFLDEVLLLHRVRREKNIRLPFDGKREQKLA